MKKVIILGNMVGEPGGFSYASVSNIYNVLLNNGKDVIPFLIRGIDDLERMLNRIALDGVFLVTYGGFGNDGTLQSILEANNISFNNNGSKTHGICYDKLKTYEVLDKLGILRPKVYKNPKYPCVIKPTSGEGGQGVVFVNTLSEFKKVNLEGCHIEQYVEGQEYTISMYKGIIGNPVQITPETEVWAGNNPVEETLDYNKKNEIRNLVKEMVVSIYDEVEANAGLRIDFRVNDSGVYVFDVNSMPILNKGGYFHRSLMDYDDSITFEFLIDDMYNDL